MSAFGGIISFNFKLNKNLAKELSKFYFEVIIANGFEIEALNILSDLKDKYEI